MQCVDSNVSEEIYEITNTRLIHCYNTHSLLQYTISHLKREEDRQTEVNKERQIEKKTKHKKQIPIELRPMFLWKGVDCGRVNGFLLNLVTAGPPSLPGQQTKQQPINHDATLISAFVVCAEARQRFEMFCRHVRPEDVFFDNALHGGFQRGRNGLNQKLQKRQLCHAVLDAVSKRRARQAIHWFLLPQ